MVSVVTSTQSSQARSKQEKILDIAAELFLERGYDAVSLDDILERAGGSKTTLYSYYGGKEGLFAAMVERVTAAKMGMFRDLDPAQLDPKAGLTAIGRRFMTLVNDPEGRAFYRMMIAEAERFPALARTFYESSPDRGAPQSGALAETGSAARRQRRTDGRSVHRHGAGVVLDEEPAGHGAGAYRKANQGMGEQMCRDVPGRGSSAGVTAGTRLV